MGSVEMEAKVESVSKDEDWGELTSEAVLAACLASAPRNAALRHPLFRRIYLVSFLLIALFTLVPAWAILYIPRTNRPRQMWTLQRCLRVRWSRLCCSLVAECEVDYLGRDLSVDMVGKAVAVYPDIQDPSTLTHSHPVTIPPAPPSHLRGHPAETLAQLHASRGSWDPHLIYRLHRDAPGAWGRWNAEHEREKTYGFEPVKAFWFTGKKLTPEEGEFLDPFELMTGPRPRLPGQPVMLHFHGGGYLCGTAAETDLTSSIAKSLVVHSPVHHVLSVDYRLAPNAPWPLPLLDAISSYRYLLDEGVPERDIIIVGDSAGGHLALALVRWLRDEGIALGLKGPRGLVIMSPWVDVGFTNAWGEENMKHNAESDTLDDTFGPFATSLLLRALPASIMHTSPYLSPTSLIIPSAATGNNSLEGFPPTYVVYGGAERLARSIGFFWSRLQLARTAELISGKRPVVEDRLIEGPDAVHDFMIFPWQSEDAAVVYEGLDVWLRDLLVAEGQPTEEEAASPDWKDSRKSLKTGKSPRMGPTKDRRGVLSMFGDMGDEGRSMIDMPPLVLDAGSARQWLTPFTAQYERGEWDWEERGRAWYEVEQSLSNSVSPADSDSEQEVEDRKAR